MTFQLVMTPCNDSTRSVSSAVECCADQGCEFIQYCSDASGWTHMSASACAEIFKD